MKPTDKNEWFRSVSSHNYEAVRTSVDRFRRCVDNNDETALMLATRTNDLEMVKILAKYEAGSFNKNFQTALMIAAARDYTDICKVLAPLEKHVTLPDGRTALMLCAAAGSYDTVRAICKDFGIERDASDWTALDHACAEGHHDCAKIIARSPAYNIEDIDKSILIAESFGNNAIADMLRDIRDDLEAKIRSCKRCQETAVELRILEKENRRLHEKMQELEDKGLELASQVETSRSLYKSRTDNTPNSLELMYEVAKRDLEDKCREYENLKEDFVTLQNEYQDVRNQLRVMSESVEELTNPNSKLAKRMGIRDEREEELLRLKAENERLEEEVEKLRKYIDTDVVSAVLFNFVEQNLKNALHIKDQEIMRLEEKIQQNFVDVEALERKVLEAQHIKEQLLKLQNDYAEARNETFVQNEAIIELKDELARTKASDGRSAKQLETEIAELQTLLADKATEFDNLKSDMYEVIAHTTMAAGTEDMLRSQLNEKERLIQELEVKLNTRRAECERLQQKNLDLNDDLTYLAEEMSKAQGPGAPGLDSIVASSRVGANRTGSIGGTRSFVAGANNQIGANTTLGYTRELDESLRQSFDANATVTEVDISSETLLMKAAASGDIQSVKKLIYQAGSANNLGKTAMMYAAENGHVECVRSLMLKEARMQDEEGRTALFYASWHGYVEIVRLLVEREARLVKKNGYSSLMIAAVHGHLEVCKLLLAKERGLYTNKLFRHGAGHTALMCAAEWGDVECVKLLLSAEAHMRDRTGRMAFNFAKTEEVRNIISEFVNRSRIEVADNQNTTTDGLHRKVHERTEHEVPEDYKEQIDRIVKGTPNLSMIWNVPYNFNNGDLTICKDVLFNYLENNTKIPWDDLKYMFCDIFYGGHVGDDLDRRLMRSFMDSLMSDALFEDGKFFAPDFPVPSPMTYDGYKAYIAEALPEESPKMYGLHPNAEIMFLTTQSNTLFMMLMQLQPRTSASSSSGELSREDRCKAQLEDILDMLPENFDMLEITDRVEERTPYVSVCLQECGRMNELLTTIKSSLKELALGLKGDLTISEQMEALMQSMYLDVVPAKWEAAAYPSMKTLGPWLKDMIQRCDQLVAWSSDLNLPKAVWLPALFNPQSFLRAVLQSTARMNQWPLDKMALITDVTKKELSEITAPPREGAYIYGLYMEGARWDKKGGCIRDSILKDLFPELPPIYLKAVTADKADLKDVYDCPVYKTKRRGPTYIWTFQIKTREPPSKWILAGVSLLMAADI